MHFFKTLLIDISAFAALIPSILGASIDIKASHLQARNGISSLDTRQTSGLFQNRLLDIGSTFAEENNGFWQLIDCDGDGIPDLVYIKTQNTGTGKVEVHIASAASKFKTRIFEAGTTFGPENDGTWLMVPSKNGLKPDLAFIKTANAGTNSVEVHIASGVSNYLTRIIETGTDFGEETDGTWSLFDFDRDGILDLVFIKTSNTGTNSVEVHVSSGASNYKTRIYDSGSDFAPETDGFWSLTHWQPGFPDLTFIKTSNTGTSTIEVHVSSRQSNYATRILDTGTGFAEENNGFWSLVDYNRDGNLDLVYIKTQQTGTGTVEVHIASEH